MVEHVKEIAVRTVVAELAINGSNAKPYGSADERVSNENAEREAQQHRRQFVSTPQEQVRGIIDPAGNLYRLHEMSPRELPSGVHFAAGRIFSRSTASPEKGLFACLEGGF